MYEYLRSAGEQIQRAEEILCWWHYDLLSLEHDFARTQYTESDAQRHLQFAALELRQAIEILVHRKIKIRRQVLPPDLESEWRPNVLVKIIDRLIDPKMKHTSVIRYSRESSPGVPTGNWREFPPELGINPRNIDKRYNRLGQIVHQSIQKKPFERSVRLIDTRSTLLFLRETLEHLRPFAPTNESFFRRPKYFPCVCGETLEIEEEAFELIKRHTCRNDQCRREYALSIEGDKPVIKEVTLTAQCSCGALIILPRRTFNSKWRERSVDQRYDQHEISGNKILCQNPECEKEWSFDFLLQIKQ